MSDSASVRARLKKNGESKDSLNGHGSGGSSPGKSDDMLRPSAFTRRSTVLVIVLVFSLVYWASLSGGPSMPTHSVNWWDENFHLRFGLQKQTYAVVIDAGSTGSRVSAFAFHQSIKDRSLKLKAQLFEEIKPGLSSFADNPDKGAEGIKTLLKHAQDFIPKELWGATPISLKATAGLRLLPAAKADAILAAVSKVISNSGFHAVENAVGIMDGVDEGIFSWFTVNFLLDRIGGSVAKTVAALDLGGGSTQITVASSTETETLYPKAAIQNISLFHQNVPLYTHSYLGLGLQSVRKSVLSFNHTDPTSKVLYSVCVNPAVTRDWTHGGDTYTIKGVENGKFEKVQYNGFVRKEPVADWDECYNHIVKLIEQKEVIKPKDLNRQVVLFSYFFERGAEAGLIDPKEGGKLTVQHYFDAGKKACRTVNADLPLLCLDVTYMGALLHNGYGLAKHTPLLALKKVNGYEISWALGLAYHILQNEA